MTQPELSRLLQEVGAVPAPAADYGAVVRASVAKARLVRTGVLTAVGLALGAGLVGSVVALGGAGDGPDSVAQTTTAPTPDQEPTPTVEPTVEPTPTPTPEPTLAPTPDPTTAAPVATQPPVTVAPPVETTSRPVTRQPTPRKTTKKPTPAPTYAAKGAGVTVRYRVLDDQTHRVEVTVIVQDNDGYLLSGTLDFGDGSSVAIGAGSRTCGGGGTAAQPSSTTKTFTRTYTGGAEGKRVEARVTTGSTCRSTPRETASGFVFVYA